VHASLTRRGSNRIGEKDRQAERPSAAGAAVAVVAETVREAKTAVSALRARVPSAGLAPTSLAAYLANPAAPSRVILCATRGSSPARGLTFLGRAAGRLLWPAPPADIGAAIGGLRESAAARAGARRAGSLRAALLLEGRVDHARARAALAAAADAGPFDWIAESVRHVRIPGPGLALLDGAGIRWSVLEPVELLAVYATGQLARALRGRPWLPGGTPVWIRPSAGRR
jgi:hypothetical protein